VPVPGCPLKLSDSPVGPLRVAPPLGESTDDLLAELVGAPDTVDGADGDLNGARRDVLRT
jgi:crotonobetainyl-CoA:carnitine CoA-transferase CaiB-like acyl-CoA transferase